MSLKGTKGDSAYDETSKTEGDDSKSKWCIENANSEFVIVCG
jgi:hypothetical protein